MASGFGGVVAKMAEELARLSIEGGGENEAWQINVEEEGSEISVNLCLMDSFFLLKVVFYFASITKLEYYY